MGSRTIQWLPLLLLGFHYSLLLFLGTFPFSLTTLKLEWGSESSPCLPFSRLPLTSLATFPDLHFLGVCSWRTYPGSGWNCSEWICRYKWRWAKRALFLWWWPLTISLVFCWPDQTQVLLPGHLLLLFLVLLTGPLALLDFDLHNELSSSVRQRPLGFAPMLGLTAETLLILWLSQQNTKMSIFHCYKTTKVKAHEIDVCTNKCWRKSSRDNTTT